jgi:hypothetical protein
VCVCVCVCVRACVRVCGLLAQELKEGFAKERHADAAKYAELERQRIAEGLDWERKLEDQQMEQDRLLTEMEAKFQQKIMNELERYSALIKDKEALNLTWDEQNSRLMDTHEHVITELTCVVASSLSCPSERERSSLGSSDGASSTSI